MNLKNILVVLGSPNSDAGELGPLAKSRLDLCLSIYKDGMQIICTGGWGERFNTTDTAHAEYLRRYLISRGIPQSAFLNDALSSNSVDDAVKTRQVIAGMADIQLTVISSDFHVERIQLIFGEVLGGYTCSFIGAKSNVDPYELIRHAKHEREAIEAISQNGLYYDKA